MVDSAWAAFRSWWRPDLGTTFRTVPPLQRQSIDYSLIGWSASGRLHRDTLPLLRTLIKTIASKLDVALGLRGPPPAPLEHHAGRLETPRWTNPLMLVRR